MALVTSPAEVGAGLFCGMAAEALPSTGSGMKLLKDCRPIGVGEVIDGGGVCAGIAGIAPSSPARGGGCCSLEFSTAGTGGGLPLSSRVIAILKVPSTMMTTLAPTSRERIFEVMEDGSLALPWAEAFAARPVLSGGCAAAAACAARRAAAMKLDVLTGSRGAGGISLMAFSDAAMRSDGEGTRADGLVPGSSG